MAQWLESRNRKAVSLSHLYVISVLIKSICPDIPCIALMDGVLSKFTQTDVK